MFADILKDLQVRNRIFFFVNYHFISIQTNHEYLFSNCFDICRCSCCREHVTFSVFVLVLC